MINELFHIGVAVADVDEAITFFEEKLGAKLIQKIEMPWIQQISALMSLGNFHLEVMQGTADDSVISRFVREKGEGLHHISVKVDEWQKGLEEFEGKGLRIIGKNADMKTAFIHPKTCKGILVEVTQ